MDDLITKIDVKQTFELLSMEGWSRVVATLRDVRLRRDTVKAARNTTPFLPMSLFAFRNTTTSLTVRGGGRGDGR